MRIPLLINELALVVVMFSVSAHASTYDLLRMSDQLDQLDRLDLQDSLDKAKRCTHARDFPCALDSLQSARKRTHSARDKADLAAAETDCRCGDYRVAECWKIHLSGGIFGGQTQNCRLPLYNAPPQFGRGEDRGV